MARKDPTSKEVLGDSLTKKKLIADMELTSQAMKKILQILVKRYLSRTAKMIREALSTRIRINKKERIREKIIINSKKIKVP